MKVQSIPSFSNSAFKGLWGEKVKGQITYGNNIVTYDYTRPYYPFADETSTEIKNTIDNFNIAQSNIKKEYHINGIVEREIEKAEVKSPLLITKSDYLQILKGKIPNSILRLEQIMKTPVEMLIRKKF